MRQIKILVEKHPDGYVAYPLGLKDVRSAIAFHIETFGKDAFAGEPPVRP